MVGNNFVLSPECKAYTWSFNFCDQYSFDFSLVNTNFNTANTPYSLNPTGAYGRKLANLGVNMGDAPYSEIKHNILQGTISFSMKF